MKKQALLCLAVSLCMVVAGCAGSANADEPILVTDEIAEASEAVTPTEPPAPAVAEPTPRPIPEAVVYEGSGDSVIEVAPPDDLYVFKITGNSEEDHFAVKSYDSYGERSELLVNTTDPYDGISMDASFDVSMLEITASGDWRIEIASMYAMDIIEQGQTYSGCGDSVLLVRSSGKTATITGNASESHFAVKSYGEYFDVLVNEVDPYEGTVMLEFAPLIFQITAVGDWTITLN